MKRQIYYDILALSVVVSSPLAFANAMHSPSLCLQGHETGALQTCYALLSALPGQILFPNNVNYSMETNGTLT
jgi:hypothetical protein